MHEFLTTQDKELLKRSLLKKFPEDQQEIFLRRCERSKLDPFSGQIHPTLRNTKVRKENGEVEWVPTMVCVTGIYGLLAVAIRTQEYDGSELFWCGKDGVWRPEWLEEENPEASKAVIYLKHRKPETMIARWFSFVQQTFDKQTKIWQTSDFWNRMPDFMLSKCARAGALRAAFPDQLSEIYIREELGSNLDLDDDSDAAKIADAQRREKEVKIPGATVVESRGRQPTPEEAAEPAFDEDKIPRRPTFAERLSGDFPPGVSAPAPVTSPSAPVAATAGAEKEQDDLDFGAQAQGAATETGSSPAAPAPEPAWKNYVLKGITNVRFAGKKLGDLNETERHTLKTQWLPRVQEQWERANEAQRADYPMVQSCIAFYDVAKPF